MLEEPSLKKHARRLWGGINNGINPKMWSLSRDKAIRLSPARRGYWEWILNLANDFSETHLTGVSFSDLLTSTFTSDAGCTLYSSSCCLCSINVNSVIKSAHFLLNAWRPDCAGGWLVAGFVTWINYHTHRLAQTIVSLSESTFRTHARLYWKKGNKPKILLLRNCPRKHQLAMIWK